MNRIQKKFDELSRSGRKALIPYLTPEYPHAGSTVSLMRQLEQSGADLIEVGIPFSDPLADGSTIQRSSERALENGATVARVFDRVREFRTSSDLPVLLMGYVNPLLRFGMMRFLETCVESGVDGLIIPDLPPEEAADLCRASEARGISNVFLIAPTSSDERIRQIDGWSTDFSYCVSVTGVTGARAHLGSGEGIYPFLQRVRAHTTKRFVVGFGISDSSQVERVWRHADGAVIGSALIAAIGLATDQDDAVRRAGEFLKQLRPA